MMTGTMTLNSCHFGTLAMIEKPERPVSEETLVIEDVKQLETLVITVTTERLRTPERAGQGPALAESLWEVVTERERKTKSGKRRESGRGVIPTGRRKYLRRTGVMGEVMAVKMQGLRADLSEMAEREDVLMKHLIKVRVFKIDELHSCKTVKSKIGNRQIELLIIKFIARCVDNLFFENSSIIVFI